MNPQIPNQKCRRVKSPEKRRSILGQLANHESTSANADTWLGKPLALGLALFYLAMRALKPGHGASGAARIVVDTALIFTMYHACLTNWGHWVRLFAERPLLEETSEAGAHVEWLLTVRRTRNAFHHPHVRISRRSRPECLCKYCFSFR